MRYSESNSQATNAAVISDGAIIEGTAFTLTNTEAGRIVGGVQFVQGGSTLINELGGIVRVADGVDEYNHDAITGSAGADTVINAGRIGGRVMLDGGNDRFVDSSTVYYGATVDLGSGDDTYESIGRSTIDATGGAGRDRVILRNTQQEAVYAYNVRLFEDLTLSGNGQYFGLSDFSTIRLDAPADYGVALIASANPDVDLTLNGNSLRLHTSTLRSITGSAADERVELNREALVSGAIALGGGDDRLELWGFPGHPAPVLPGSADGGAGRDTLRITLYDDQAGNYDLSSVAGFERLEIGLGGTTPIGAVQVTHAAGLTAIDVAWSARLVLSASALPGADLSGAVGGTITIEQGSSIGRYAYDSWAFAQPQDFQQADDRYSTVLTNRGQIGGTILFYTGDDRYDGSQGSVGGTVFGNAGNDTLIGGAGAETFDGGFGADSLFGNGGGDTLIGGAGGDTLDGGAGVDTMIGGAGNDVFYVDAAGDSVIEAAGEGSDRVFAGVSYTLGAGSAVEMVTTRDQTGTAAIDFVGNALANTLVGNAGANILNGGEGADVLVAFGGNDVLIGGDGAPNALQGGTGDDTYYVSAAGDSVIEFAGEGNDTVRTGLANYRLGGNVENLVFVGTGGFVGVGDGVGNVIVGAGGGDILNGLDGDDILVGFGGDDVLIGGTGNNTLQGGVANDTYYVTSRGDSIVEAAGEGYDTVRTELAAYTLGGSLEALVYIGAGAFRGTGSGNADVIASGAGADELYGLGGDDTLSAGGGADYLFGGEGNDQLNGGAGNDRLTGGAGADMFVFADASVDTITDFAGGVDRILLDCALFTALSQGSLAAGAFVRGGVALEADDRILYDPNSGALLYDADGSGAGAAVQIALVSVPTGVLGAGDFLVV